MRIIVALDIIEGKCVRLTRGDFKTKKVYNEDPLEVAKEIEGHGIEYLHLVDLDGAKNKKIENLVVLEKIAWKTNLKIDFGGGLRFYDDLLTVFNAGARQVTVGSIAVNDSALFLEWLSKLGQEKLILGADCINRKVSTGGWLEHSDKDIITFISEYRSRGVKYTICTDIKKDGMLQGPSTPLYEEILGAVKINLIASGGISSLKDIEEVRKAGCEGAIIGKAVYEGKITLKESGRTMLKRRIIPCLDIKDGRTVKGVNFINLRDAGDPVELAKVYVNQGADELVFLDITATIENRKALAGLVERIAAEINIPFTVGGGINSVEDVAILIKAGADKVTVNSSAVRKPQLISEIAGRFGNQCVVVAIDTKLIDDEWIVFVDGGRTPTELKTVSWAHMVEELGAGEILLTSMNNDGTKSGFSIDITAEVSRNVNIPVIASGGAGTKEHFREVFFNTGCSAALAASIFHFGEIDIRDLKNYLKNENIAAR